MEMYMKRIIAATIIALMSAGCVSTPQTKALFTPVGAIGVHSFAPTEQERRDASEADRLAHMMQAQGKNAQTASN